MAEPATRFPMMTETDDARPAEARPFEGLRQEIDRMFDDFQRGYWRLPFGRTVFDAEPFWRGGISWNATPAVDIVEHEHGYRLTAELPGIEEKNVSVSFADGTLTIKAISHPITLDATFEGAVAAGRAARAKMAFVARGEFDRRDYAMDFNIPVPSGGWIVGNRVRLELDVEANLP